MTFSFDECVSVLFAGLVQALEGKGEKMRELHLSEQITAISYDVLPWDPYVGVALRIKSESTGLATDPLGPGDWKHSHFIDNPREFPLLERARNYVHDAYKSVWEVSISARERAHVILSATARALLDERIAFLLQSFGIPAPIVGDNFPWPWFEYIVSDDDRSLKINYCELLHVNRINRRLGFPNI